MFLEFEGREGGEGGYKKSGGGPQVRSAGSERCSPQVGVQRSQDDTMPSFPCWCKKTWNVDLPSACRMHRIPSSHTAVCGSTYSFVFNSTVGTALLHIILSAAVVNCCLQINIYILYWLALSALRDVIILVQPFYTNVKLAIAFSCGVRHEPSAL